MATTGRCLCGAVSYSLGADATGFGACHCGMCRRWPAAVHFGVEAKADGIAWTGSDAIRAYASSDRAERGWCDRCGTHLFWRMTAAGPHHGVTALSAGTLDDVAGMAFDKEIFVDQKPVSYAFAGNRPRMAEAEVIAAAGVAQ